MLVQWSCNTALRHHSSLTLARWPVSAVRAISHHFCSGTPCPCSAPISSHDDYSYGLSSGADSDCHMSRLLSSRRLHELSAKRPSENAGGPPSEPVRTPAARLPPQRTPRLPGPATQMHGCIEGRRNVSKRVLFTLYVVSKSVFYTVYSA